MIEEVLKTNLKRANQTVFWMAFALMLFLIYTFIPRFLFFRIFEIFQPNYLEFAIVTSIINFIYQILILITSIFFIRCFRRAYCNLFILEKSLNYSERRTTGSWFVPIMNLLVPYKIMMEIFQKTNNILGLKNNYTIINLWWLTFLLTIFSYLFNTIFLYLIGFSVERINYIYLLISIIRLFSNSIFFILSIIIIKKYLEKETLLFETKYENPLNKIGNK